MKKQQPMLLNTVAVSTDYTPNKGSRIYLALRYARAANSYSSALYNASPSPQ